MSLQIRPAVVTDAHGIAVVHIRAWQETYTHLVSAEALASLPVEPRERRWSGIIADPETDVWVAERDGEIVGWASAGSGRGAQDPREHEVEGIYVLATEYGSGAGQALLDAIVGDAPAFLWVAADNPRAQAFYRRNGFALDGPTGSYPLAGEPVDIVRMVRGTTRITMRLREAASGRRLSQRGGTPSYFSSRDSTRSAKGFPPVWQVGQYWNVLSV